MKFLYFGFVLVTLMRFPEVSAQELILTQNNLHIPNGITSLEIPISSTGSYTVTGAPSWLTFDESNSTLSKMVFIITNNSGIAIRTANIIVKLATIEKPATIIQHGNYDMTVGRNNFYNAQAFPGAEGGGALVTGGRGGIIYYVTSLADTDTPGTLRYAVSSSTRFTTPLTVLFKISGIISLTSNLSIKKSNLTIAGQSAPGDGICFKNYSVNVSADNVIIRFMRFRMGDETANVGDALEGQRRTGVIIDHCSISWSTDECSSFYDNTNFTMQWCILSESLRTSVHDKVNHGYGGIWGGQTASFHHNLLAHHDSRNPRMNGTRYIYPDPDELVDFRNNVIYNWGSNSGYAGEGGRYNFINNFYRPGPASSNPARIFQPYGDDGTNAQPAGVWGLFYVSGNYMTNKADGTPNTTVIADNWTAIHPNPSTKPKSELKSLIAFDVPSVTTHSAEKAFDKILSFAGNSFVRDTIDKRIAKEALTKTITFPTGGNGSTNGIIDTQSHIGGWPVYNTSDPLPDTDSDGIPDIWEDALQLDKNNAADGKATTLDPGHFYTNVEVYLATLVQHIVSDQLAEGVPSGIQSAIDQPSYKRKLKIYQTSVNSLIVSSESMLKSLQLYNTSGTILYSQRLYGLNDEIQLGNIRPGFYVLTVVFADGKRESSKLIIKK
jgi:hypothetical protein